MTTKDSEFVSRLGPAEAGFHAATIPPLVGSCGEYRITPSEEEKSRPLTVLGDAYS